VKNLFSSQLFSKLREEDTKQQTELTNRNRRRGVLYGEHERLMNLVHAEMKRILRGDDAA
jgi:hypothetical protein